MLRAAVETARNEELLGRNRNVLASSALLWTRFARFYLMRLQLNANVRPQYEGSASRLPHGGVLQFRVLVALQCALAALTRRAQAQVPFEVCLDRDNHVIPGVVDNTMAYAGMAAFRDGHPVILWNAHTNQHLSQTEQIFIYLHECAHHTLGHLYHYANDARDEQEADCWAIQFMMDGGMIQGRHLAALERSRRAVRGDYTHLGGEAHIRSLEECLAVRTDHKAWATALDTVVSAAQDSFAGRRGRLLDSTSASPTFEALVDVPGTYDCEVVGAALRCMVFAARKDNAAKERYGRLLKIIRAWLSRTWTSTERNADDGKGGAFLAQDALTGTLISLAWNNARVYLVVKRVPA
jgi:hypothetical protein